MAQQDVVNLPDGWMKTTIGDYLEIHNGKRKPISLSVRANRKGQFPYYGATGVIDFLDDYTHEGEYILIGEDGANLLSKSKPLAFLANGKYWVNNHAHTLKCSIDCPNNYIEQYVNSLTLEPWVTGSAQPKLNKANLEKIPVPLAPLPEQKRIVEKLDSLLAQVDTIQQRLNNLPDIIKRFRQSVLAAAVSGKLTEQWRGENPLELLNDSYYSNKKNSFFESKAFSEQKKITKIKEKEWFYNCSDFLPKGWVDAHLIDITSVITCGVAKKPNYLDNGVKFLSAQNVKPFLPNLNKYKYISQSDFDTFTTGSKPEKGDVLYSRVGANFGEACVIPWDFDFAIYVSLTLIKPNNDFINEKYLTMFLNSKDGVLQSRGGIMGSGIQNLNVENVRKYRIPLPSISEQTEIVRLVEQYFALADTLEKNLANAKQRVDNLTQSILAKAFKGELVPQDPNDEPADKLLERIKAARIEAEKLKKAAKKAAKAKKK